MVARSYMFSSPRGSPSSEQRNTMGIETARPASTPLSRERLSRSSRSEAHKPAAPSRTATEPVLIPSISMYRHPRPSVVAQTVRVNGRHGDRRPRRPADIHDPNAIPPAVAALLAVTAIPPPKRKPVRPRPTSTQRRISIDELVQEWKQEAGTSPSLSGKSPLDILLEPADEDDEKHEAEDMLVGEPESEKEAEIMTSRSVSSISLTSTPSLDAANSTMSSWNSPSTPSIRSRRAMERKEKLVSSPPTEDCHDDHPLRPQSPVEPEYWDPKQVSRQIPKPKPKPTFFKSNLTASLQALKSAAKSLSNFAAPSIPSDDMLSRSLFGSRFAPEMRPYFQGTPDPALRRYLNPTATHPFTTSCPDFTAQLQESLIAPLPSNSPKDGPSSPMIQMQTYKRIPKRSRSAPPPSSNTTSQLLPPDRAEAAVLAQPPPNAAIRQREPRENSDFLRMIVLEMNMRRMGKLDSKAGGRARVWLPPRKSGTVECGSLRDGVPLRWVVTSSEDLSG
jgi:hypothetical protein